MIVCEKCKAEYEEFATYCNACDLELFNPKYREDVVSVFSSQQVVQQTGSKKFGTVKRISGFEYLARISYSLLFFWMIYGFGILHSAGFTAVIENSDFSALYENETATLKFFIPAMILGIISLIMAFNQRFMDINLGTLGFILFVFLMVKPSFIVFGTIILALIPGSKSANKYGEPPPKVKLTSIIFGLLASLLIWGTIYLARAIKASDLPI